MFKNSDENAAFCKRLYSGTMMRGDHLSCLDIFISKKVPARRMDAMRLINDLFQAGKY